MTESEALNIKDFSKKVWIAAAIVMLLILLVWFIQATFSVLLLVLAGALIALYFKGLANLLISKLHVPDKAALAVSVIVTVVLLTIFFWFMGTRIQAQLSQLTDTIPSAIDGFKQQLKQNQLGQKLIQHVESDRQAKKLSEIMQSLFRSTFGTFGDMYVVLFLGIFFTTGSNVYIKGFLSLIPPKGRQKARTVLMELGTGLTKWLKGKLFAMLVVAILTAAGLSILGVPMAFALALIAGILNFIPNFGPLIAMVPAILVGLMQGTKTAWLVAVLYVLVQVLESNVITPQIQKRLVNIPAALIILAQLFMGALTGGWGLILATPVVVILVVVLQKIYINPSEEA